MSSKRAKPEAQKAFMAGFIDFDALTRICDKIPPVYGFYTLRNAKIHIPNDLYHQMHDFYGRALSLAEAMETVLDDREHQLVCEEARMLGKDIPDLDVIRADLDEYREFLNSFDAYDAMPYQDGHVRMDIHTVIGHRETIMHSRDMLKKLWQGCFETEYIDYFTILKQNGVPYAGGTALQQMMNVAMGFTKMDRATDKYQRSRMMQKHWPEFTKS